MFPSRSHSIAIAVVAAAIGLPTAMRAQQGSALASADIPLVSQPYAYQARNALTLGAGTPITQHNSISATVTIPSLAASTCSTTRKMVAGAADGDSVALGVGNALAAVEGVTWFGWASAANTVSIRACNATKSPVTIGTGTVRIDIWKH